MKTVPSIMNEKLSIVLFTLTFLEIKINQVKLVKLVKRSVQVLICSTSFAGRKDEAARLLIRVKWKNCFSSNEFLHDTNSNIVWLQCKYQTSNEISFLKKKLHLKSHTIIGHFVIYIYN